MTVKRLGFVSNSSSSSFIISSKEKPVLKVSIDISSMCDEIDCLENLVDHFRFNRSYGEPLEEILENEYERNLYTKCKEALERGETIYLGSMSSDAYGDEPFVYQNGLECGEINYEVIQAGF